MNSFGKMKCFIVAIIFMSVSFGGFVARLVFAADGDLRWDIETGGYIHSSPTVGPDRTIYFGSSDKKMYAVSSDGNVRWAYETGDLIVSSPAVNADGIVYFGSNDDYLYGINPDGTLRWRFQTGGDVQSSPAIGSDGTVYVGSYDNRFYALSPEGSLKWSYVTSGYVHSSPAISENGTIYVGSNDHSLYAFNPDGSVKWKYITGHYVRSSPVIGHDGTIYVGSNDNNLYAVKPDGSLHWTLGTGYWVNPSPAIGVDGTIYVGSNDNNLYAINPSGMEKWAFKTEGSVISSPVIGSDGSIYVGSSDMRLYGINPDGSLKWSYNTGGYVRSSPAIDPSGTVCVGSYDHRLYAIEITEINPPAILSVTPQENAVNVPVESTISVEFSEPMDPSTITLGNFYASDGMDAISGTVSYSDNTATFTPDILNHGTTYTATVTSGVADFSGNPMQGDFNWSFTTVPDQCPSDPDKTEPGACGCGVPETDSDSDLTPDCIDEFPVDPNEWIDTDGDGIGNNEDLDDDNDGIPDDWEGQHGLDPLVDDSSEDPDGDGVSNIEEYLAGTDPIQSELDNHISLNSGWNLISLDRVPQQSEVEAVLQPISGYYSSIWTFTESSWRMFDPNAPEFSDLTMMETGKGYWISMNEGADLVVSGASPSAAVSLSSGWNLVGYNASTPLVVSAAVSSIEAQLVSVWAFLDGTWLTYDPLMPAMSDLTEVSPGYGYWINVTGDCVWTLP